MDNKEIGIIKRGEVIEVEINKDSLTNVYFVPKAPRLFGWKALVMVLELTSELSYIQLGVQIGNKRNEIRNAITLDNQLHVQALRNCRIMASKYIKKYDKNKMEIPIEEILKKQ